MIKTLVLGAVQGLCEFLPVSSSGHLALLQIVFGYGENLVSFDILLHFATLLAVVLFFWRDILQILCEWFGGWFTNSACTEGQKAGGASVTPTANITYYAKWTANTYKVHFNGTGSTSGTMQDQSFTYDVSQELTANSFERKFKRQIQPVQPCGANLV